MDRQRDDQKIVRIMKHFISVSNEDSNDYGVNGFNPGQMNITFNNSGITNIQSYNDSTTTIMHPISLTADIFYNNISSSLKNNQFRLSTITTNASPAIRVGATTEAVAPITITIPDGIYKTGTELATRLTAVLNAKLVAWIGGNVINNFLVAFSQATNAFTLSYNIDAPAGIAALLPILVLTTVFTADSIAYDSSRIWGTTSTTIAGVNVNGTFQLPYADRVAGIALPSYVDLQTLQVLRVHSNVAKRYFSKVGAAGASASSRPLSLTDILFEIPLDAQLGQTLVWSPPDDRWSQEIASNFDEMRLTFTDNKNNIIQFINSAEINFQFYVERSVIVPNNEERIKALSNYNQFKSY